MVAPDPVFWRIRPRTKVVTVKPKAKERPLTVTCTGEDPTAPLGERPVRTARSPSASTATSREPSQATETGFSMRSPAAVSATACTVSVLPTSSRRVSGSSRTSTTSGARRTSTSWTPPTTSTVRAASPARAKPAGARRRSA